MKTGQIKLKTEENQVKAGGKGGIEAVVKAINTHKDNKEVCREGCRALRNIISKDCKKCPTTNNTNCKTDENELRAGEAGAIEAILDVLKEHTNNLEVCKQGCDALDNMTKMSKFHAASA